MTELTSVLEDTVRRLLDLSMLCYPRKLSSEFRGSRVIKHMKLDSPDSRLEAHTLNGRDWCAYKLRVQTTKV